MKPKQQRFIFVVVSVIFVCAAVLFTLRAFRGNMIYFYDATELAAQIPDSAKLLRVGGIVKKGSVISNGDQTNFMLTDGSASVYIHYQGTLPGLFREGQGVIAEGYLVAPNAFSATTVMVKHDEKYMPKEVVDALKRDGRWHEGEE